MTIKDTFTPAQLEAYLTAVRMYEKLGAVVYRPAEEPRPDDLHLIYDLTAPREDRN